MPSKEQMIESLKDNCGGECLTNPDNCECFTPPTQEMLDDLGMDLEDWAVFDAKEECPHYDAMHWATKKEIECARESINNLIEDYFEEDNYTDEYKKTIKETAFNKYVKGEEYTNTLVFIKVMNRMGKGSDTDKDSRDEYVYMLLSDQGTKIGRSHEPQKRSRTIGTKTPFEIKETKIFKVSDMAKVEIGLHHKYREFRLNGEWFDLSVEQINKIEKYLGFISVD